MAKLAMGILGGFSGKVGTVVGSIWKGINTIRAYVANPTNPNTPAQLDQRAQFSLVVSFLKPLTSFLRTGYKSLADKMTAFNAATRDTLANAITGTYPDYLIDYPRVKVSQGSLQGAVNAVATSTVANKVSFAWDDNSGYNGAAATDKAMLVVYNPSKAMAITQIGGNARDTSPQVITLPLAFSGDLVQCYLAFADANGSICSDSQFVGAVDVV